MQEFLFFCCLPIVAFLYATVGHGGASGYLALLSIFSFSLIEPQAGSFSASQIKTIALTLNLFVAGISFFQYFRAGYFDKKLFLWLSLGSVPMAFWGGSIQLETKIYFYALALFLLLAGIRLLTHKKKKQVSETKLYSIPLVLIVGASIGFVAGLLGIGGGIILSPLILLFGWSKIKTTAGISALFIFVNSLAGLGGQFSYGLDYPSTMPLIIVLVILGGILGSYLGAKKLSASRVKQLLAFVLLLASIKIFLS
jgi:uncharacterized membrane protein YfcA